MTTDPDPRLLRLPATVHRRFRLQAGVGAEVVQHPVGLQGEQIGGIALLRIEERAVEEAHLVQRERGRPAVAARGARLAATMAARVTSISRRVSRPVALAGWAAAAS